MNGEGGGGGGWVIVSSFQTDQNYSLQIIITCSFL